MMGYFSECRDALRTLWRSRGFAGIAVVTFALGIMLNVAVLAVLDRVLFRPLPYGHSDRLVHLYSVKTGESSPQTFLSRFTTVNLRLTARSFDGITPATSDRSTVIIDGFGGPLTIEIGAYDLLHVLEVTPIAGRDFRAEDISLPERALLLSDETWRSRFNRSKSVIDSVFRADKQTFRVVGILPPGFVIPSAAMGDRVDAIVLNREGFQSLPAPGLVGASAIGRLRPGVTLLEAQAEMDVEIARERQQFPDSRFLAQKIQVQSLRTGLFFLYRPYAVLILSGGVVLLLASCVNLSILLLARGRGRESILAVRAALGASRGRLIREVMFEATALCVLGTFVAVMLCTWAFAAFLAIVPTGIRGMAVGPLDFRIIAVAIAVAGVSALAAGAFQAIRSTRLDVVGTLQGAGRQTSARLRGGTTLMIAEAAIGLLLTVGAAIMISNFAQMAYRDPGFDPRGLYIVSTSHGSAGWMTTQDRGPRISGMLSAIKNVPNVDSVALVSTIPFGLQAVDDGFWKAHGGRGAEWGVSADFVRTLRGRFRVGRPFSVDEIESAAAVAIVNLSGARRLWPGESPENVIGRSFETLDGTRSVVGVVDDVQRRPGEDVLPALYVPLTAQEARLTQSSAIVLVRTGNGLPPDVALLTQRLDEQFGKGALSVNDVRGRIQPWLERPRLQAVLFGAFGIVSLVLTAIGLYALTSFEVTRRRFEVGVRMAIGASRFEIYWLLIWGALRPVLLGIAAGLIGVWWTARFTQAFLYDLNPRNPIIYAVVVFVLLVVTLFASWLPARRAARGLVLDMLRSR